MIFIALIYFVYKNIRSSISELKITVLKRKRERDGDVHISPPLNNTYHIFCYIIEYKKSIHLTDLKNLKFEIYLKEIKAQ